MKDPIAAEHREQHLILIPDYLVEAEEAADTAVDTAESVESLCQSLRETPGAHKDVLHAIDTPNAHHVHEIEQDPADEQTLTQQPETSTDLSHDEDRDLGMGL